MVLETMMLSNLNRQLRWYEQDPEVYRMVESIRSLDSEYQDLIGQVMYTLLDGLWDSWRYSSHVKEVGVDRQIGLLKSQNRRRWYDQEPNLRRAFIRMSLLQEEHLQRLVGMMNPALDVFKDYFELAQKANQIPDPKTAMTLFKMTLERDEAHGRKMLDSIFAPRKVKNAEEGMRLANGNLE